MSETDSSKKTCIDLSDWNLDEVLNFKTLEQKIREVAAWVIEYTFKDKDNWGIWCSFGYPGSSREHPCDDPLDLLIAFPCLDEDPYGKDGMMLKKNLRDFIEPWPDYLSDDPDSYSQYLEVAAALRKYADEIEHVVEQHSKENP